jgi:hypothetical protein
MPPIEAMVAVVIAGVIGWLVFPAFFAAGDRLQRVRTDPTQSAGRRRETAIHLLPRNRQSLRPLNQNPWRL